MDSQPAPQAPLPPHPINERGAAHAEGAPPASYDSPQRHRPEESGSHDEQPPSMENHSRQYHHHHRQDDQSVDGGEGHDPMNYRSDITCLDMYMLICIHLYRWHVSEHSISKLLFTLSMARFYVLVTLLIIKQSLKLSTFMLKNKVIFFLIFTIFFFTNYFVRNKIIKYLFIHFIHTVYQKYKYTKRVFIGSKN